MKITIFQGDLTDIPAKKEALPATSVLSLAEHWVDHPKTCVFLLLTHTSHGI